MRFQKLAETENWYKKGEARLVTFNSKLTGLGVRKVEILDDEYGQWTSDTIHSPPVSAVTAAFVIKEFGIETLFMVGPIHDNYYSSNGYFSYI